MAIFFYASGLVWRCVCGLLACTLLASCGGSDMPYSDADVCRGVIAAYVGRDVDGVAVDSRDRQIVDVSYAYEGERRRWRCRVELPRVRIASYRDDGELGRWRDSRSDDEISVDWYRGALKVLIVHPDASRTKKSIPMGAK